MRFLRSLWRRTRRAAGPSRRPVPTVVPTLEALEARLVPTSADNLAFVNKIYQDLLHRAADAPSLQSFSDALDRNLLTRTQEVLFIEASPEGLTDQVGALYQQFLGRAPDAAGLVNFVNYLAAGGSVEGAEAALIGSPEFFQKNGVTSNDQFATAVYQAVLGRAPDPTGQAGVDQALAAGYSPAQVALALLESTEYKGDLVEADYQAYLHRAADPAGLAAFVTASAQGIPDQGLVAALLSSDEYAPGADAGIVLAQVEVEQLLDRASAASASNDAIIAVVDRNGRILGVRVENGVSPAVTTNIGILTYAIDGALAEARTGAYFANDQAPLTARTVQEISQSTITQREVDSNPDVPDANSPFYGPGYVAPVGLGGHFPPNVPDTPPVDLFGIEHTNRDSLLHPGPDGLKTDGTLMAERFNLDPAYVPPGQTLSAPESWGFASGLLVDAQARGIGTLPGGIPIYKDGELVGGIGVFFPGTTGYASAENSSLSATHNPALPDRSLEAEYMAFAAVGGAPGLGLPVGTLAGIPALPGVSYPLQPGQAINLAGISLDLVGPGGTQGPYNLVAYARGLGVGNPFAGVDMPVDPAGDKALDGRQVPVGWLELPHDSPVDNLTANQVLQMILQGINQAVQTRAQIRLPIGVNGEFVFAVSDSAGNILGLYRMPDATVFSIEVAVAKARNVAYFDDPTQLQPADQIAGLPPGVAMTSRDFRFLAQPRYPEGIDGTPPAPQSILNNPGINPANGLDTTAPLPGWVYQAAYGYDSFHPMSNFHDPNNLLNQSGVVWFPGSSAVFLGPAIAGGLGVSGDGVTQDDLVTAFSVAGFAPPANLQADQYFLRGARLPYFVFPRNPTTP